jgi:hypothetical protein
MDLAYLILSQSVSDIERMDFRLEIVLIKHVSILKWEN